MAKRRILIIDDIQSVRSALRGYLCPPASATDLMTQLIKKGTLDLSPRFLIDEAGQGLEGVQMAKAAFDAGHPYEIAFIDMLMPPGIHGGETIRLIREFDSEICIVVCTALTGSTAEDLAVQNGGVVPTIIQKPVTSDTDLESIINASKRRSVEDVQP